MSAANKSWPKGIAVQILNLEKKCDASTIGLARLNLLLVYI